MHISIRYGFGFFSGAIVPSKSAEDLKSEKKKKMGGFSLDLETGTESVNRKFLIVSFLNDYK